MEEKICHITVHVEKYERYAVEGLCVLHISAPTILDALDLMLQNIGMYVESIEEIKEEMEKEVTVEDVIDRIVAENGEGCDFVLSIKNDDTGESIYESEYFEETTIS